VGDPVAGALAEEVAKHRLDRADRVGLADLAEITHSPLKPLRPVLAVTVLTAVRVGDDADFHRAGMIARVGRDAARRNRRECRSITRHFTAGCVARYALGG